MRLLGRAPRIAELELGRERLRARLAGLGPTRWLELHYDTLATLEHVDDPSRDACLSLVDGLRFRLRERDVGPEPIAELRRILAADTLSGERVPLAGLGARIEAICSARGVRVAALVDFVLANAVAAGASDLHLEASRAGDGLGVRLRLDGRFLDVARIPADLAGRVATRLKLMAGLSAYRSDIAQEGRIDLDVMSDRGVRGRVSLRASFVPTVGAERIALRVFDALRAEAELEDLGFGAGFRAAYAPLLERGHGLVLVAGPSSQGKTTTVYTSLRTVLARRADRVGVASIEDPVEYDLPGIDQIPVARATGASFASVLSSVLRQDLDVIAVGEIRDAETAEVALRAALTGHLILSTVHAATPLEAVHRLLDLGVDERRLRMALRAVVAQRLVPRRCSTCGGERDATPTAACAACEGRGERGRVALAELVRFDADDAAPDGSGWEERLAAGRRVSFDQAARDLVARGLVDEELLRDLA